VGSPDGWDFHAGICGLCVSYVDGPRHGGLKTSILQVMSRHSQVRKRERRQHTVMQRVTVSVIGLSMAGAGVIALLRGRLEYVSFYRLAVFAPYAVVVGLLLMVVAWIYGRR